MGSKLCSQWIDPNADESLVRAVVVAGSVLLVSPVCFREGRGD
jgi:hypothetical protein